ncbi:MAG: cysteine desulfurase NifS [Pseudomonadota bacterium]
MPLIYVDNNATTPVAPEVLNAMLPFLRDQFFNPSSAYEAARGPSNGVDRARQIIADLLGAPQPDEILFTSCGTESNNTAIRGAVRANPHRRHVITSAVEHPAVLEVCKALEREGFDVTYLPVDRSGQIDIGDFVGSLRDDTLLVSLMHGNNETGVIFPVEDYARITKETDPRILFHTDATQTVGKLPIDLKGRFQHVDMLTFSAHKLHAPKGVGALFTRRGTPVSPFMLGGHQERSRRAGTENVAGIVGMAKACELAMIHVADEQKVRRLRDRLEKALVERIPYTLVNGGGAPRLPNTLNASFHYIEGESILFELDRHQICASSGSACTSGSLEPSHVLMAMRVPFTAAHGSIRYSFSRYNTEAEVDHIIEVMPDIVAALRKISPYWDQEKNAPRAEK